MSDVEALRRQSCYVAAPARTSVSVLDMNDFRPGRAGGGNIGFAFSALTEVRIELSRSDEVLQRGTVWKDERRLIVAHVLDEWRRRTKSVSGYNVMVIANNSPHTGFASSGALQLCVWSALNYLHGDLFSSGELRQLIADAYRESTLGVLTQGFTTGLSSFLGMRGGFAVVERDLRPVFHSLLPNWSAAVVVPQGLETVSFGETETRTLTSLGPLLDKQSSSNKLEILYSQLIPAIEDKDLAAVGEAINCLQMIGSKVAEIGIYGSTVSAVLNKLRSVVPCAFMSAVGPGIAVVTENTSTELASILSGLNVQIAWIGEVDNIGIRIRPQ